MRQPSRWIRRELCPLVASVECPNTVGKVNSKWSLEAVFPGPGLSCRKGLIQVEAQVARLLNLLG